jgi:uncharacterized protein
MILASILWRRLDAPGHDACRLEKSESGWILRGNAAFRLDGGPASLAYDVRCGDDWKTVSGRIEGAVGAHAIAYLITRQNHRWRLNGEDVPGLDHLDDLDFGFTPATNLLQVKRVALPISQAIRSPAAWFDIEAGALTELEQIYERRSETALFYRAPGVGYEGLLELAPNSFIRLYPGLWEAEEAR